LEEEVIVAAEKAAKEKRAYCCREGSGGKEIRAGVYCC
jgi:hypothetical protein